jgi:hypothetical protein
MDKLNVFKLEILDKMPMLLYTLVKNKFPDTETTEPTTTTECFEEIKKILVA